jgi:hypothetical protein
VLEPGPKAVHLMRLAESRDPGPFGELAVARDVSAVTGSCLAIRRAVFDEIGGFDAGALPVAFNDIDLCLRARSWISGYLDATCRAFPSRVCLRGYEDTPEKLARLATELQELVRTWGTMTEEDPYLNPNLHYDFEDGVSLASPPRRERPWLRVAAAFPPSGRSGG